MKSFPNNVGASHWVMALVLGLGSTATFAQQDATKEGEEPVLAEEVVVIGTYQKSLQSALDQKRNSASVIEAISASDIGQLPDVSITESLARLPGVAQDRDRGNGSQISIRGMGGQLSLTTLNGREVATVEEDRNIRYDQFPAELINAAQVYKTPQAKLVEGGVSGTVNLQTVKPLDYSERVLAVGGRATQYSLGNDIDDAYNGGLGTRYSVAYVDKFADDTLGVAIGLAGQDSPIATQRAELWNYGDTWHNMQYNDDKGTTFNAPWGGSALVRGGKDSRFGSMAVLEWAPSDNFKLGYDFFYSSLKINEQQRGFDFQIDNSYGNQWQVLDSTPTMYTNPEDEWGNVTTGSDDMLSGSVNLSSLRSLNEQFTQSDELISHGLNLDWSIGGWEFNSDLSYSETSRDRMWHTVRTANNSSSIRAEFGATGDGRMQFSLAEGIDLTDPLQNSVSGIQVQPKAEGSDAIAALSLSAKKNFDSSFIDSVEFGFRVSDREKSQDAQIWTQEVTKTGDLIIPENLIINASADSYWSDLPLYMTLDREGVMDAYFGGLANPDPGDNNDKLASWKVTETISSSFVQANISTDVAGLPLTGNIGVRFVTTETGTEGSQLGASVWVEEPAGSGTWVEKLPVAMPVSTEHSYSDILPSLNLSLALNDNNMLRFAAAKTIARAPLDFLSPAFDVSQDQWGANPGESGSGNPYLEPFRATQADVTYEWYFGDANTVAGTVYYKDMDSYIARQANAKTVMLDGSEYQLSLPVNGSGGYIRGFELMYQQAFDFLPEPFSGLGVYANYAYADTNIKQGTPLYAQPFGLTGLSEHVGTFTLWHYLAGFESRLSYNYRSDFQRDVNRVMGEEGVNAAEGYWDLSFSYEVSENLKVMLQAQNLTDEPYKVYGLESNNEAHVNKYEEFGQRFSLGVNWTL